MKKTDFPDKCSACRLLNRDKMRAALEGDTGKVKQKEVPVLYNLDVVEYKKGKGPKKAKSEPKKQEENKKDEGPKRSVKFIELIKEASKEFPALPEWS